MPQRKQQQKDVLQRLADSGEEALQKFIADLPGGSKVVGAANSLFARVDELSKRMRSLDPLERRVAELENRLDALTKPAPAKRKTTARKTTARKPPSSRARKTSSS
jgi:ABC-type Fe3+ transport system substrate-binding protein